MYDDKRSDRFFKVIRLILHPVRSAHLPYTTKESSNHTNVPTADGKFKFDIGKARKVCADHGAQLPMLKRSGYQDQLQTQLNGATRFALGLKPSTTNFHCKPGTGSKPADPQKRHCYTWDDGTEADNDYQGIWPTKFTESAFTYVDFDADQWVNALADGLVARPISVVCQEVHEPQQPTDAATAAWSNNCLRGPDDDYIAAAVFDETHCYFLKWSLMNMTNKRSKEKGYTFSLAKAREACESEGATLPIFEGPEESREAESKFIVSSFFKHFAAKGISERVTRVRSIALSLRQISHPRDWWWHTNVSVAKQKFNDTQMLETNEYVAYTTINRSHIYEHHDGRAEPAPIGVVCKQSNSESNLGWCIGPMKPEITRRSRYQSSLCYFAVKDAAQKVNQEKDGKYLFDIEKARQFCHSYNATLAIASDPQRIQHLVDMVKDVGDIVLGLNQTITDKIYTYTWDDGTPSEFYFQPLWPTKFDQAAYTKMSMSNLGSEVRVTWVNVPMSIWSDRPVHVVCQQLVPSSETPKAPPGPPSIVQESQGEQRLINSHCDEYKKHRYSATIYKASKNGQLACYYIMPAITTDANRKIEIDGDGGKKSTVIRFSMSTAREQCHKHGGVLVAPDTYGALSEEEYKFIATNYGPEVFAEALTDLKEPVNYVALGLSQLNSPNAYKWDASTIFERPSWQWTDENAYAYMTVMSLSSTDMSFVNFQTDLVNQTIGVLCRYMLEHFDIDPTTDAATKYPRYTVDPLRTNVRGDTTTSKPAQRSEPVQEGSSPGWDGDDGKGSNVPMHYWVMAIIGTVVLFWY